MYVVFFRADHLRLEKTDQKQVEPFLETEHGKNRVEFVKTETQHVGASIYQIARQLYVSKNLD
jgi:hypothetical protein